MYISLLSIHFKLYVQEDCYVRVQNNVSGKSQDDNTTMLRQEKCQGAEISLMKSLA